MPSSFVKYLRLLTVVKSCLRGTEKKLKRWGGERREEGPEGRWLIEFVAGNYETWKLFSAV